MKAFILQLIFISISTAVFCQQVVSSAGSHSSIPGYTVDWTIGEPVIETIKSANNMLTQGLHQTMLKVTAIDQISNQQMVLQVYPNPAATKINLVVKHGDYKHLQYQLFSLDGRKLAENNLIDQTTEIPIEQCVAGIYLLQVSNQDIPLQSFRIVKNQP